MHFYAGVQTMRARICSAISCDMFARVVWLRLRRAQSRRLLLCHLPHALATHYFLRLTRARGRRFLRGWKILLNDFWYFSSLKSTIKNFYILKTPHPSRFACHLLPQEKACSHSRQLCKSVKSHWRRLMKIIVLISVPAEFTLQKSPPAFYQNRIFA